MRIQVNLSEEMVNKVDFYAKKIGVSRSSLCSLLVGQGILGFDKSFDILDKIKDSLVDELKEN